MLFFKLKLYFWVNWTNCFTILPGNYILHRCIFIGILENVERTLIMQHNKQSTHIETALSP